MNGVIFIGPRTHPVDEAIEIEQVNPASDDLLVPCVVCEVPTQLKFRVTLLGASSYVSACSEEHVKQGIELGKVLMRCPHCDYVDTIHTMRRHFSDEHGYGGLVDWTLNWGVHCPGCGVIPSVMVEPGTGDYYEGQTHLCIRCGTQFTMPSRVDRPSDWLPPLPPGFFVIPDPITPGFAYMDDGHNTILRTPEDNEASRRYVWSEYISRVGKGQVDE